MQTQKGLSNRTHNLHREMQADHRTPQEKSQENTYPNLSFFPPIPCLYSLLDNWNAEKREAQLCPLQRPASPSTETENRVDLEKQRQDTQQLSYISHRRLISVTNNSKISLAKTIRSLFFTYIISSGSSTVL